MKKKLQFRSILIISVIIVVAIIIGIAVSAAYGNRLSLSIAEAQEILDDTLSSVYSGTASDDVFTDALREAVRIKVNSVQRVGDGWQAECEVTSIDLATCIVGYIQSLDDTQVDSLSNVISELREYLSAAQVITKAFEVRFEYTNKEFQPVFDEELVNFCSGNVQEVLPILLDTMQGGVKG